MPLHVRNRIVAPFTLSLINLFTGCGGSSFPSAKIKTSRGGPGEARGRSDGTVSVC